MTRNDFITIAKYVNEINRGFFTDEEIKEYADVYYNDYILSKETKKLEGSLIELANILDQAESEFLGMLIQDLEMAIVKVESSLNDFIDFTFIVSKQDEQLANETIENAYNDYWEADFDETILDYIEMEIAYKFNYIVLG